MHLQHMEKVHAAAKIHPFLTYMNSPTNFLTLWQMNLKDRNFTPLIDSAFLLSLTHQSPPLKYNEVHDTQVLGTHKCSTYSHSCHA